MVDGALHLECDELMWCKVWCKAKSLICKSQNGLQSRLDGFDSRPRLQIFPQQHSDQVSFHRVPVHFLAVRNAQADLCFDEDYLTCFTDP